MSKGPEIVGPTAAETALAEVSKARWDVYVEDFRPAEIALAQNAELTKGEKARVKGEVSADTAAAFKGLARSTIAAGAASGANVASGKTKFSLATDAAAAGATKGLGQTAAITGAELDAEGKQLQIVQFGHDVASNTIANLSRGAQRATTVALAAADAKFERNNARLSAVTTIAGAVSERYQINKTQGILDQGDFVGDLKLPNPRSLPFEANRGIGIGAFRRGTTSDPFAGLDFGV